MQKIAAASKHHPLHSRRKKVHLPFGAHRFLAAFEGIEGGFAVGTSIIVALSFAGISKELLLVTAVVSIIVSGFNSSSVKYSSEHYLDQLDGREKKSAFKYYFMPSLIEFICYILIGFLVILPLLVVPAITLAVIVSVLVTLVLLFVAGYFRGYMLHMNSMKDGIETMLMGLGIVAVGLVSGLVIHTL